MTLLRSSSCWIPGDSSKSSLQSRTLSETTVRCRDRSCSSLSSSIRRQGPVDSLAGKRGRHRQPLGLLPSKGTPLTEGGWRGGEGRTSVRGRKETNTLQTNKIGITYDDLAPLTAFFGFSTKRGTQNRCYYCYCCSVRECTRRVHN